MKNVSNRSGFSIVEIMVVIGIISILATVVYVNFSDARQGARDQALMTEIRDMRLALELYKEQNGEYPPTPACGSTTFGVGQADSTDPGCGGVYIEGLVPDFISELPSHENSPNGSCRIRYSTDDGVNSWYKLTAVECASDKTVVTQSSEMARCPASCPSVGLCAPTHSEFASSFAIYSFGGECQ